MIQNMNQIKTTFRVPVSPAYSCLATPILDPPSLGLGHGSTVPDAKRAIFVGSQPEVLVGA